MCTGCVQIYSQLSIHSNEQPFHKSYNKFHNFTFPTPHSTSMISRPLKSGARKANAFMPTHSKCRDGFQMVRVVNEEESEKKQLEKDMENKLLYIRKDVGTGKETMQKSLVTMMKQLNLHLRKVCQYVNEFANAEGNQGDNMAMGDDVLNQGDPWMEFGDEARERICFVLWLMRAK